LQRVLSALPGAMSARHTDSSALQRASCALQRAVSARHGTSSALQKALHALQFSLRCVFTGLPWKSNKKIFIFVEVLKKNLT